MAHTTMSNNVAVTNHKKWLLVTLAAAALTLSACGKKEDPALQGEPGVDAQTSVEQEATGVANDDVAVASANDGMASAEMTNDDVAVATADDSEIIDGTETEEHISTY